MSGDYQEHCRMVAELVDELENLNDWENDFILGLAEYEERGRLFSKAQQEKIEELYTRYLG